MVGGVGGVGWGMFYIVSYTKTTVSMINNCCMIYSIVRSGKAL